MCLGLCRVTKLEFCVCVCCAMFELVDLMVLIGKNLLGMTCSTLASHNLYLCFGAGQQKERNGRAKREDYVVLK